MRHITFGTPNYSATMRQLQASATRYGLRTFGYTPSHPVVADLLRHYPEIMHSRRGAGYWLWKPRIILDALENSSDETIVVYTDAAMRMVADPRPLLACALEYPVMIFDLAFPVPDGP